MLQYNATAFLQKNALKKNLQKEGKTKNGQLIHTLTANMKFYSVETHVKKQLYEP